MQCDNENIFSACKLIRIRYDTSKKTNENWSFKQEEDQKIIECCKDGQLDDDDELFRRAYWVKDWHLIVMTNERIIVVDTDLNELKKLGQFIGGFVEVAYQWNIITTCHNDCPGLIVSSAIV